jgi:transposase-like protein
MCPYCGEWALLRLDPGSGPQQRYVEDCPVCCRPWDVRVTYLGDGSATVELRAEDEG